MLSVSLIPLIIVSGLSTIILKSGFIAELVLFLLKFFYKDSFFLRGSFTWTKSCSSSNTKVETFLISLIRLFLLVGDPNLCPSATDFTLVKDIICSASLDKVDLKESSCYNFGNWACVLFRTYKDVSISFLLLLMSYLKCLVSMRSKSPLESKMLGVWVNLMDGNGIRLCFGSGLYSCNFLLAIGIWKLF